MLNNGNIKPVMFELTNGIVALAEPRPNREHTNEQAENNQTTEETCLPHGKNRPPHDAPHMRMLTRRTHQAILRGNSNSVISTCPTHYYDEQHPALSTKDDHIHLGGIIVPCLCIDHTLVSIHVADIVSCTAFNPSGSNPAKSISSVIVCPRR